MKFLWLLLFYEENREKSQKFLIKPDLLQNL